MTEICRRDEPYQNKNALPCTFQHLGEGVEIVVTIYVPGDLQNDKNESSADE
jgi:hypothetical protein